MMHTESTDTTTPAPPPAVCDYCGEAIRRDPDQGWIHIRTGLPAEWRGRQCQPPCKQCGGIGTTAIGGDYFDGAGIRFRADHFLCNACAAKTATFERVR